ncbi:hypothetical protein FPV67DRAFT_1664435 [Lyophyllum atratum]|nr:hypothetical protein FPV67DRAFT_1664435 [Lyophyllum atratum]
MSSPYATVEDPQDLWYEQSNFVATHLAAMGYGLHVAIFFIAAYHVLRRPQSSAKSRIFWLAFLVVLLTTSTINIACSIKFNQSAWVDERNYPGGPIQFMFEQQSRPILTLGNTASILASFLADGLLLYRAMVLWNYTWYIILLPTLFFIVCVILSILTVIQIAIPDFAGIVNLAFPVWLVLMIINIVLSAMIAVRILSMRRAVKSGLGDEYARPYTTIAAIVVEAALPFTILSIILLVLFGGHNTAQNLFVPLLVQVECIAPALIILRVIRGRGADNPNTRPATQPLKFAANPLQAGTESTWTNPGVNDTGVGSESSVMSHHKDRTEGSTFAMESA